MRSQIYSEISESKKIQWYGSYFDIKNFQGEKFRGWKKTPSFCICLKLLFTFYKSRWICQKTFIANCEKLKLFKFFLWQISWERKWRKKEDLVHKNKKKTSFFSLFFLCIYTILHLSKLKRKVEIFHEVV